MSRVLIPLPDRDFDVTETAVPWKLLTAKGHEVVFATERGPKGDPPACDPLLLSGVIFGQLGAKDEPKSFYGELAKAGAFERPIAWSDIDPAAFDALILPGGHAPGMRQYLGSDELQAKVAAFAKRDKPLAAICHGVLVLARARDADTGKSPLFGKTTTCLPKFMEKTAYYLTSWKLGRYYRTYDAWVEDEVRAALEKPEHFVRGPLNLTTHGTAEDDRGAFVVESGSYVSARWPGDAFLFAKKILARLS
jgi:putative intracellular protease/amidase